MPSDWAATIEFDQAEVADLVEALDYAIEDLTYRLRQGKDYEEQDARGVEARIARYERLISRLT